MPNYLMSPITQGIGGGTIASAGALGNVQGFQSPYRTQLSTSLLSGMRDNPGMGIHAGGQFLMDGQRTANPLSNQSLMAQGPAQQQAYQQYQAAGGAAQNYDPFVESSNATGSQIGSMGGSYLGGQLQGVRATPRAIGGMTTQDWAANPSTRFNQQTGQQQQWMVDNSQGWHPQYGFKPGMNDQHQHVQRLSPTQGMWGPAPVNSFQGGAVSAPKMTGMGFGMGRNAGMGPNGNNPTRSMGPPNQGMGIMPTNTNQSMAQGLRTV